MFAPKAIASRVAGMRKMKRVKAPGNKTAFILLYLMIQNSFCVFNKKVPEKFHEIIKLFPICILKKKISKFKTILGGSDEEKGTAERSQQGQHL